MCAIGGLISFRNRISDDQIKELKSWGSLLRHRGPDQQGSYFDTRVGLINNRLAVMDPRSHASLPMTSDNGDICLAYNGEISNFRELTLQFQLADQLKTRSDSEVIIHLYQLLGIDFIQHLSGMFSIALYDKKKEKVFLVRDFYGITPLFVYREQNSIYFSSEIKAFLSLPRFDNSLNEDAFNHFFSLAYIPGELTPYSSVQEIDNGHFLTIDLRTETVSEKKYYQLNYKTNESINEEQASEQAYELLRDSVRRNLSSDAPLGVTLSGGLDTSSIVGLAKDLGLSKGLKTYSIKMGDSTFDESKYQRLMAEFAQTDHHELLVNDQDILSAVYSSVAHLDEPCGDGAIMPFYLLGKFASQKVKVLLSGEGGDEVFNAYETHGAYKYRQIYRHFPQNIRNLIRSLVHRLPVKHQKLSLEFLLKRFIDGSELGTPESHIYWRHPFTDKDKQSLFKTEIDSSLTNKLFSDDYNSVITDDDLNRISYLDIEHFFYGDLMLKSDRMFMAHSIETRFPFMDRPLVDFMTTVPPSLRIKGFRRRHIQKKAMKRVLPKEIWSRGNFGLELPNSKWLGGGLQPLVKKYFHPDKLGASGLLNVDNIQKLIEEHFSKKRDLGRGLWCLLNFQIWFELFIEKKNFRSYMNSNIASQDKVFKYERFSDSPRL